MRIAPEAHWQPPVRFTWTRARKGKRTSDAYDYFVEEIDARGKKSSCHLICIHEGHRGRRDGIVVNSGGTSNLRRHLSDAHGIKKFSIPTASGLAARTIAVQCVAGAPCRFHKRLSLAHFGFVDDGPSACLQNTRNLSYIP